MENIYGCGSGSIKERFFYPELNLRVILEISDGPTNVAEVSSQLQNNLFSTKYTFVRTLLLYLFSSWP